MARIYTVPRDGDTGMKGQEITAALWNQYAIFLLGENQITIPVADDAPTGYRGLDVSALSPGTTVTVTKGGHSDWRNTSSGDTLFLIYNRHGGAIGFAGVGGTAASTVDLQLNTNTSLEGSGSTVEPLRIAVNEYAAGNTYQTGSIVKSGSGYYLATGSTSDDPATDDSDYIELGGGGSSITSIEESVSGKTVTLTFHFDGGGSATVSFDTEGLHTVATDTTISGDGTTNSPLSVAEPYTAAERTKLASVEDGAQANVGLQFTQVQSDAIAANTAKVNTASTNIQDLTNRMIVAEQQNDSQNTTLTSHDTRITAAQDEANNAELEAQAAQTTATNALNTANAKISQVASDSTLSGQGTTTSPLSVANEFTDADEAKLDALVPNHQWVQVPAHQNSINYNNGAMVWYEGHIYTALNGTAYPSNIATSSSPDTSIVWKRVDNNIVDYVANQAYTEGDFVRYNNQYWLYVGHQASAGAPSGTDADWLNIGAFTPALQTKLAGIAEGAQVNPTQATQAEIDNPDGVNTVRSFSPDQIDEIAQQYGGGIGSVQHDDTLDGEGTSTSDLSVARLRKWASGPTYARDDMVLHGDTIYRLNATSSTNQQPGINPLWVSVSGMETSSQNQNYLRAPQWVDGFDYPLGSVVRRGANTWWIRHANNDTDDDQAPETSNDWNQLGRNFQVYTTGHSYSRGQVITIGSFVYIVKNSFTATDSIPYDRLEKVSKTPAQIAAIYESADDRNAFTDALKSKLQALPANNAQSLGVGVEYTDIFSAQVTSPSEDTWTLIPNSGGWHNEGYDEIRFQVTHTGVKNTESYLRQQMDDMVQIDGGTVATGDAPISFPIGDVDPDGTPRVGNRAVYFARGANNNLYFTTSWDTSVTITVKLVGVSYKAGNNARYLPTRQGLNLARYALHGIYIDGDDGKHYTIIETRNHAEQPLQVSFSPLNKLSATPFEVRGFAKENITNLVSENLDAQTDLTAVAGVDLQGGVPTWLNALVNYSDDTQTHGDLFLAIDDTYTGNAPAQVKVKVGANATNVFNVLPSTSIASTGNDIYAASTTLRAEYGNIFAIADGQTDDQVITIDILDADGNSLIPNSVATREWKQIDVEQGRGAFLKYEKEEKPLAKQGQSILDFDRNMYVGSSITTPGVVMHLNKKGGATQPLWGFDANRRTSITRTDIDLTELTYDETESVPEIRFVDAGIAAQLRDGRLLWHNDYINRVTQGVSVGAKEYSMKAVIKPAQGHPDDEHALYFAMNDNNIDNVTSPASRQGTITLLNHGQSASDQWRETDHVRYNASARRFEFDHPRGNGDTQHRLMGIRIKMIRQGDSNSGRYRYHVPAGSDAFALSSTDARASAAITPDIGDIPAAFRRFGIWALDVDFYTANANTNSLSFSAQFNEQDAVFNGRKLGLIINVAGENDTAPFKQMTINNIFEMVLDPPLTNNHAVYNFATGGSHPSPHTLPNPGEEEAYVYVCPVLLEDTFVGNNPDALHSSWCPNIYTHMVVEGVEIPIQLVNITEDYTGSLGSQPRFHYQTQQYSTAQHDMHPMPTGSWNCNFRTDNHVYHSKTRFLYDYLDRGYPYVVKPQSAAGADLYASAEQYYWDHIPSEKRWIQVDRDENDYYPSWGQQFQYATISGQFIAYNTDETTFFIKNTAGQFSFASGSPEGSIGRLNRICSMNGNPAYIKSDLLHNDDSVSFQVVSRTLSLLFTNAPRALVFGIDSLNTITTGTNTINGWGAQASFGGVRFFAIQRVPEWPGIGVYYWDLAGMGSNVSSGRNRIPVPVYTH